MRIPGRVHCLFEQSGTFKKEFLRLGFHAEDYDIQDEFNQTDHKIDLFAEIEKAYSGGASIFDTKRYEDLILAFFPCVYFSCLSQMGISFGCQNYKKLSIKEKTEKVLERSKNREYFFSLIVKLFSVVMQKGLRMIVENPYSEQTFLKSNFILPPTIVDTDRTLRGDLFRKPTAYWFVNCTPTCGLTEQRKKAKRVLDQQGGKDGICSTQRSTIHSDYARNFICDFILGKEQKNTQLAFNF